MKRLQTYLLGTVMLLACGTLGSCVEKVEAKVMAVNDEVVTKTYDIKDFTSIQAGGSFKIKYVQSSTLQVDCDELEFDNTGASHITLSGRAKKTNSKSSGFSGVKYKEFNME